MDQPPIAYCLHPNPEWVFLDDIREQQRAATLTARSHNYFSRKTIARSSR
jgi:hypothetical protein